MNASALVDLSPVLHVMLLGASVALGPLAWVALRHRGASGSGRLAALTLLTLFLTFDLVLFGAFTRLTDSGLGCPDWPGCYGHASPSGAVQDIAIEQARLPSGPVTHRKAWIEMIHRYLATSVGVLIITLLVATWRERRAARRGAPGESVPSLGWPALTLFWVCLQGAFGALTVTMKLFPAIVTLHLLGGIGLVALLVVQAVGYRHAQGGTGPAVVPAGARLALVTVAALLWLQVALGGWVSTNYAVLACNTFPQCQGTWWPDMDFAQGFEVWRPLGLSAAGDHLSFAALTAIHYVHRLVAYALLPALAAVAWLHWRGPLRAQARWLAALAALQLATGLSNVVLDWPIVAAVLHTGGAAALVAVVTWALRDSRAAVRQPARTATRGREVSA